jgi:Phage integrase family
MRKSEVLNLRWSQLDLKAGAVRLEAEDTKTDEPRVVYLTERVLQAISEQPRLLHAEFVFVNPATGLPWQDLQGALERARKAAGLDGVWVHDLRREPGAPERPPRVGGGALLRPSHRGGLQALQHRRGAGSQGGRPGAEPDPEDRRTAIRTGFGHG